MNRFNVGDKVRVAPEATYGRNTNPVAFAIQGKVVSVRTSHPDAEGDITVGLEGRADGWWVDPKYLTLVKSEPKEYSFDPGGEKIAFGDVKKGDTIAHLGEDSWNVGVADRFIDDAWWTKIGNMVTCGDVDYDRRLLHRPEAPVDREQVDALTQLLVEEIPEQLNATPAALTDIAIALVKAGVRVDT